MIRREMSIAAVCVAAAGLMAGSVLFAKRSAVHARHLQVARMTEKSKALIQQATDAHLESLTDLSRDLEAAPPISHDEYRELAVRAAVRGPAFAAVNFLDHRFVETFLYPYGANRAIEGLDLKTRADALPAAYKAVSERRPSATDLVPLAQGGNGFLTYAPVYRRGRWEGLVEGALERDVFARRYVEPAVPPRHRVTLLSESTDRPFFTTSPGGTGAFGPHDFYFTMRFADRRWWIVFHPASAPSVLAPLVLVILLEMGLAALVIRRLLRR